VIDEARAEAIAGHFGRSLAVLADALAKKPDDPELLHARALTLFDWDRVRESLHDLRAAEAAGLSTFSLHLNLARVCHLLGMAEDAERHARQAIAIDEKEADARFALAAVLQGSGRTDEAIASYERAYELVPSRAESLTLIAACRINQRDNVGAECMARQAIAADGGNHARSWELLAISLAQQDRHAEAGMAFERAAEIEAPNGQGAEPFVMHGDHLRRCGRVADAIACYEKELPSKPHPAGHGHYSLALLTAGRYREGWAQYEFRWIDEGFGSRRLKFTQPGWSGQPLLGKTILVWSEQGFGDTVQMARFASVLQSRGAHVVLVVPAELMGLAAGFAGVDRVIWALEANEPFDYQVAAMSLPRALGVSLDSIPSTVPYLQADRDRVAHWRDRLGSNPEFKVGLAWAGNPTHRNDRHRSLPVSTLAPLWEIAGVQFFSLQKERREGDDAALPPGTTLIDLSPDLHDFGDTTAAIESLDLVIAVDTVVAHIAGALGKPCWLLLPANADFRWLRDREDSPWYPSMRLFRQRRPGDWSEVTSRVAAVLHEAIHARGGVPGPMPSNGPASGEPKADAAAEAQLSRLAETRYGLVQYLPLQAELARSLECYGEWLQPQLDLIAQLLRPGAVVLEAGSGIGVHALALARMMGATGHLLTYESNSILARILAQNLEANKIRTLVTVMKRHLAGLAPVALQCSAQDAKPGSLGDDGDQVDTIDDLQLGRIDLIKINDASAAGAILDGAAKTVRRLRPLLLITAYDEAALETAAGRVGDLGYRCWCVETPLFNPGNFNRRNEDIFGGAKVLVLIAVPEGLDVPAALRTYPRCGAAERPLPEPVSYADVIAEATTHAKAGRLRQSLELLDESIREAPGNGELLYARALTLFDWGRLREALEGLRAADARGFSTFGSYLNLAQACNVLGLAQEAEHYARSAIALDEKHANGQLCLAAILQTQRRFDEAIRTYERAYELAPSRHDCLAHIAACTLDMKDAPAAERMARRAIEADGGDQARSWALLAVALARQDRYDESLKAFDRADEIEAHTGQQTESFVMHGYNLLAYGRVADAIALYERHLSSRPHPSAHAHYGFALLTAGRFVEGWRQYEFRWLDRKLTVTRPTLAQPRWNGQDLKGKTLLMWAEQGFGDTIQFARFAPILKRRGASIILRVPARLKELAKGFVGVDRVVVAFEEITEPVHYQIAMMSVPMALGTTVESIPNAVPYLMVDRDRVARWRDKLGSDGRMRVGLVWAGNPNHENDRHRSVPASALLPLWRVADAQFFWLQKERRSSDLAHLPSGTQLVDLSPDLEDFSDTAAAIEALDLVIAVDTAVAHIAGALGKPCWLLLPVNADFRWMREGEGSAWYPTMRLFRQQRLGDWADVVACVSASLEEAARAKKAGGLQVALAQSLDRASVPRTEAEGTAPPEIGRVTETRYGLVHYSPREELLARSLEWYGEWLQPQLDLLAKLLRPSATVIEAASGIGVHAVALAKMVGAAGHLLAYESDPMRSRLLEQNLLIQNLRNLVTIIPRGLLGVTPRDDKTVELDTVDALRLPRLDLIKINDPSAARVILEGSVETLWRLRPILFVAANPNEMANLARDFGYRCWRMRTTVFNLDNFNRRESDIFAGAKRLTLLAIPEEVEVTIPLDGCLELQ
jgi:tetratricopeptide (TPR) repeat protein